MAKEISREELKSVHADYRNNLALWKLYMAAYKGINEIVKGSYIPQHEREPDAAYARRIKDLYSFAYSKSVTSIFTYHLMNKPPQGRKLAALEDNELWEMFFKDANLYGDSYDSVIAGIELNASIQGHMGVLIDKSPIKFDTIAQQKAAKVYPYIAVYHPPAILDWKFERDEYHRPYLSYVKLLDDDGRYRIWTTTEWFVFELVDQDGNPEGPNVSLVSSNSGAAVNEVSGEKAIAIEEGVNPLGFVPFLWVYNLRSNKQGIGESDLTEIARIDISLVKNASQMEEVINFAAFPMMLKPKRDAHPDKVMGDNQDDEIGTQSVLEYDPEYPESKPEWLSPEVKEAIAAILDAIKHKVGEIYRAANIGGLAGTQISTQAKSGVAMKAEFQILNATLSAKASNLEKAENRILEIWLKWEKIWEKLQSEVQFGRSKSFNVEDVAADLDNALTAKSIVVSKTFNALIQKQTAIQVLPSMSEDDKTKVEDEIDSAVDAMPEPGTIPTIEIDEADGDIIDEGTKEIVEE